MKIKTWILLCIQVCFFLPACSTRLPVAGVNAYEHCDYQTAIKIFEGEAKEGGKDLVLYDLALLSSAMAAGDDANAEKAAVSALDIMFGQGGDAGRGNASLISAEAIKVFKGEPFEKSMAAIYAGIFFYNRGDYDNARAAFGKALLAVKQKQESNRDDFALPYLLQAKVMLKEGDLDNARISLERAKVAQPENTYLSLEKLKSSNVLVLIELGRAPQKTRTGPGASLVEWKRKPYPEQGARVYLDGRELGRSYQVGDLTVQAKTKGLTGKDAVQLTKGITREAAGITAVIAADEAARGNKNAGWVALGAGLFALADQSQADIRQWELLPDRLHVVLAHIPEGTHQLKVSFHDLFGANLSQYDQVWYDLSYKNSDDRIFLFRASPCQRVTKREK